LGDIPDLDKSIEEIKGLIYDFAGTTRMLFALDNLESLDDNELESIFLFLNNLPQKSKAVITSRVQRKLGQTIHLSGLALEDARELFLSKLAERGIEPSEDDMTEVDALISYTGGIPQMLIHCAILIQDRGFGFGDLLERVKGKEVLELLKFSYESSLAKLSKAQMEVLLYLALSDFPRSRNNLLKVASNDDELNETIDILSDRNLIGRSTQEKSKVRFRIENRQLRDYVKKRAQEALSTEEYAFVLKQANVSASEAESLNVLVEIERSLQTAKSLAASNWYTAIEELENALRKWGS